MHCNNFNLIISVPLPWVCPNCDENNASYHQCCSLCYEIKPIGAKTHASVARNENNKNKKRRFNQSELESQSGSDENDGRNGSEGISLIFCQSINDVQQFWSFSRPTYLPMSIQFCLTNPSKNLFDHAVCCIT